MKTLIILLASCTFAFAQFSPTVDPKGFIGGTFTGNGSGLTNLPTKLFAELRQTAGQTYTLPIAGSFQRLTNWTSSATNQLGANLVQGYITNTVAGYYRITCSINVSAPALDNYNFYVRTNDVNVPWAFASYTIHDASYIATISMNTITYLPASTRICISGFCDVQAEPGTVVSYSTFTVSKE